MANTPTWDELSDQQKRRLKSLASTFGINLSGERVDDMVLPSDQEAFSIALEMYTLSTSVINECLGAKNG